MHADRSDQNADMWISVVDFRLH